MTDVSSRRDSTLLGEFWCFSLVIPTNSTLTLVIGFLFSYLVKQNNLELSSLLNRQAQNDTKKQNHALIERVQALQAELQDNEVRRDELEGQVRQGHTVSCYNISTVAIM